MSPLEPPRPWPLDKAGKPKRRVAVPGNRGVYWRPDGLLEVGYQDADGRWRWRGPFQTITAARAAARRGAGPRRAAASASRPNPRLKFGEAADRWLAEQVVAAAAVDAGELHELRREPPAPALGRPAHGRDRRHRCGARSCASCAQPGWPSGRSRASCRTANRVFKFARRHCALARREPVRAAGEAASGRRSSTTPERRIYVGDELAQVLAASTEPWTHAVPAGERRRRPRERAARALVGGPRPRATSDAATIRFTHQVDRDGERVELKTEESKATLPLPRVDGADAAGAQGAHAARRRRRGRSCSRTRDGPAARPAQRAARAVPRAGARPRRRTGGRRSRSCSSTTSAGTWSSTSDGAYVLRDVKRARAAPLPDFHALRHGAAMDCDDAEEARDLLRHKNSQRHARDLPGALRRSPARAAARSHGSAHGKIGRHGSAGRPGRGHGVTRDRGRRAVARGACGAFTRERSQVRNPPRPFLRSVAPWPRCPSLPRPVAPLRARTRSGRAPRPGRRTPRWRSAAEPGERARRLDTRRDLRLDLPRGADADRLGHRLDADSSVPRPPATARCDLLLPPPDGGSSMTTRS